MSDDQEKISIGVEDIKRHKYHLEHFYEWLKENSDPKISPVAIGNAIWALEQCATTIQQYQVREAVLVAELARISKAVRGIEALALAMTPLDVRAEGTKHGILTTCNRVNTGAVDDLLASLPQAVIPISDQDPEKLRAEGAEAFRKQALEIVQQTGDKIAPKERPDFHQGLQEYAAMNEQQRRNFDVRHGYLRACLDIRKALESLSNQERID